MSEILVNVVHVVLYSVCFYVVVNFCHALLKHTSFVMHVYIYTVYILKKKRLIYTGLLQVNLSCSMHVSSIEYGGSIEGDVVFMSNPIVFNLHSYVKETNLKNVRVLCFSDFSQIEYM